MRMLASYIIGSAFAVAVALFTAHLFTQAVQHFAARL